MAFCRKCGSEIDDEAVICPKCGVSQIRGINVMDEGDAGLSILSFLIPFVGLCLYCTYANTRPKTAHNCGKWALVSVVICLVCLFFYWAEMTW